MKERYKAKQVELLLRRCYPGFGNGVDNGTVKQSYNPCFPAHRHYVRLFNSTFAVTCTLGNSILSCIDLPWFFRSLSVLY